MNYTEAQGKTSTTTKDTSDPHFTRSPVVTQTAAGSSTHNNQSISIAPLPPTKFQDSKPIMKLPESVEGFIDLETLGNIHEALCMSEDPEDSQLAEWINTHYLFKPIRDGETGRPIRTHEGFQKLDKAYRRVCSLTNRSQSKWPFFDRTWKSMTQTLVRKVAKGQVESSDEVAPSPMPHLPVSTQGPSPSEHSSVEGEYSSKTNNIEGSSTDRGDPPLILAAHAPSIQTSLDRLPPGSALKRKRREDGSFIYIQDSKPKRAYRPKRGGGAARTTPPDTRAVVDSIESTPQTLDNTTRPKATSKKRKAPPTATTGQPSRRSKRLATEDIRGTSSGVFGSTQIGSPRGSEIPQSSTPSASTAQSAPAEDNGVEKGQDPKEQMKISLIARVQTPTGPFDVPVPTSKFAGLEKLEEYVSMYIQWREEAINRRADTSFEVFMDIFALRGGS